MALIAQTSPAAIASRLLVNEPWDAQGSAMNTSPPAAMPTAKDVGYMEAFMDWFLIYRTEAQLRDLTAGIPASELVDVQSSADPDNNIVLAQKRRMLPAG